MQPVGEPVVPLPQVHGFFACIDVQAGQDFANVPLRAVFADAKPLANLWVRHPPCSELQHLALALRQRTHGIQRVVDGGHHEAIVSGRPKHFPTRS